VAWSCIQIGVCVLQDHISHWVPGMTEIESSVAVEVSGVKPYHNSLLYKGVHVLCCFI
jgi:hypothetical protein